MSFSLPSVRVRLALAALALVLALGFLPASVVAEPLLGPGCSYTVRPGDTLYGIAYRYGVTVRDIVVANGILNANYIWSGKRLTIPRCGVSGGSAASAPAPAAPAKPAAPILAAPASPPAGCFVCTISAGQSIAWLADDYGSTIDDIMRRNGLTSSIVYPGQRLIVCPRQ